MSNSKFPIGTVLLVAAGVAVAYVAIKRPAIVEPIIQRAKNMAGVIKDKVSPSKADKGAGAASGSGTVPAPETDGKLAADWVPSLGVSSLGNAPGGADPEVYSKAQWYLTNAPRLN